MACVFHGKLRLVCACVRTTCNARLIRLDAIFMRRVTHSNGFYMVATIALVRMPAGITENRPGTNTSHTHTQPIINRVSPSATFDKPTFKYAMCVRAKCAHDLCATVLPFRLPAVLWGSAINLIWGTADCHCSHHSQMSTSLVCGGGGGGSGGGQRT